MSLLSKAKVVYCIDEMEKLFPNAGCELLYTNEFSLLIAVLLSAQTTDKAVNNVTPVLFEKFPSPYDLAEADVKDIEECIKRLGLYKNKAKNIKELSIIIVTKYNGRIPREKSELVKLPGVGIKTANVVVAEVFNEPAIAVDTHVERVSKRLGVCRYKDNVGVVEETLKRKIPKNRWIKSHHLFIHFGRYHCLARNPKCSECPLNDMCRFGIKTLKKQES